MSRYFDFQSDVDNRMLTEAFNSTPYEITFGKKGAGDIFFTFLDEDEKEFRIQFYTPAGLGKKVRQVFIGQKKGGAYPDVIQSFKDPMRVIATMVEATKQFLQTPIGKGIDGFAINFSKKALVRGTQLLPKIIKQSDLRSKLEVLDLSYTPVEGRAFVWCLRKGKKAKDVFDGPKMEGVTWDKETIPDTIQQNNSSWEIGAARSGVPTLEHNSPDPRKIGGINLIGTTMSPKYGTFIGSSKGIMFNEITDTDLNSLAKKLKLPTIPQNIIQEYATLADKWWKAQGLLTNNTRIDHRELGKRGYYDIDGVGSPRKGVVIDAYDRDGNKVNGKITDINYSTNMMEVKTSRGNLSLKFIDASKNDIWKREVVPLPLDAAEEYMNQIQSEIRGLEKTLGVKAKSSGRLGWMFLIDGKEYYVDFNGLGTESVSISTNINGVLKSETFDDVLGTGRLYLVLRAFVSKNYRS